MISARLEPSEPRGGGAGGTGCVTLSLCTLGRAWLLRGADGGQLGSFLKEEPRGILRCGGLQGIPLTDLRGAGAGSGQAYGSCCRTPAHTPQVGYELKDEIERKFDKWQEPPPVKQVKPLPAPLDGQRKKRGGRRWGPGTRRGGKG